MKNFIYLLITVLVIGGIWFYFNKNNIPANDNQATTSLSSEDIILYKEDGVVSIKLPTSDVAKPVVEKSTTIQNKTIVNTGTSSKASVLLPDNSVISLSENTEITIDYTASSTNIFQSLGSTYNRVQTLIAGKSYEVQTPSTLAAVRGTKFAVIIGKNTTKISVTENKVAVSRIKRETPTSVPVFESPVMVESGNLAEVIPYNPKESKKQQHITVILNKNDPEVLKFIEENKTLDEKFQDAKNNTEKNDNVRKEKLNEALLEKVNQTTDINKPKIENDNVDTTTKSVNKTDTSITTNTNNAYVPITTNTAKKYATQEEFYSAFDDLFIKYLYVDNDDATCRITNSPVQKVKELSDMASANNQAINKDGFLTLANHIKDYCDNTMGDSKTRTTLQAEFDSVTPQF